MEVAIAQLLGDILFLADPGLRFDLVKLCVLTPKTLKFYARDRRRIGPNLASNAKLADLFFHKSRFFSINEKHRNPSGSTLRCMSRSQAVTAVSVLTGEVIEREHNQRGQTKRVV
jgi:hypothetical protein